MAWDVRQWSVEERDAFLGVAEVAVVVLGWKMLVTFAFAKCGVRVVSLEGGHRVV